jgi:hypothetical protein
LKLPESYQEAFMWMFPKAFEYYFPVIDRYLATEVEPVLVVRDDEQDVLRLCRQRQCATEEESESEEAYFHRRMKTFRR